MLLVLVEGGRGWIALFLWLLAWVGLLLARTSRELRGTFAGSWSWECWRR